MSSTQITCPHCGSSLNFGRPVTAGSTVECLICMQPFPAPVVETSTAESAIPVGIAITALPPSVSKPASTPTARPAPVRRADASAGAHGKGLLLAMAAVLLLFVGVGVAILFVKLALSGPDPSSLPVAWSSGDPVEQDKPPADPGKSKSVTPNKAATIPIEDDEDTRKLKELEKKLLVRKTGGGPPDPGLQWQTPAGAKIQKDIYAGLSQKKVDHAIQNGILFLKKHQAQNGTWAPHQPAGHAALGGLTMLECKVPANDPHVQRAAHFVRLNVLYLPETYELALAILFLDRLGEPRDRPLIQGMALRLLAGQQDSGGWSYQCPLLNPAEMYQLFAFLHSHKDRSPLNPLPPALKDPLGVPEPQNRKPGRGTNAFEQFEDLVVAKAPAKAKGAAPIRVDWLKPDLQQMPVVRHQGRTKAQHFIPPNASGDNSTTQFALLGLWTARRHDVPTDHAILVSYQRFVRSQNQDGGWGYMQAQATTKSMTCVGLLGMAMGHAAAPDIVRFDPKNPKDAVVRPALEDARIQRGLKALGSSIGEPILEGEPNELPMQDLYFLWSVERVAMLYDLKTIHGKEWYPWGAQVLVHRQQAAGDWNESHYPGASPVINTCFALLFLQRSNLVQDLTNHLRFHTGIREGER